MYVPIALFFNYLSPFSWWVGPVLQILGFFCLWLSRYTARWYPVLGKRYYVFSSIVRPIGIFLIAWAWVEIFAVTNPPYSPDGAKSFPIIQLLIFLSLPEVIYDSVLRKIGGAFCLAAFALTIILAALTEGGIFPSVAPSGRLSIFILASGWSIWSILHLGLRESFLYSRIDDPLVTTGPYSRYRHPQLLGALIVAYVSIIMFQPPLGDRGVILLFRFLNFLVMVVAVLIVASFEDKDMEKRFGEQYAEYRATVPAFLAFRRRAIKNSVSMWKAIGLCLGSYFLANIIFYGGFFILGWDKGSPIFLAINPRFQVLGYATEWDLSSLFKHLEPDETGKFPKELSDDQVKNWRERDRTSRYSPYPQTLFYCDQVYYSDNIDKFKGIIRFPIVRKLPFPLKCTDKHVEIAQAMDYDGDGFPQVFILIIDIDKDYSGYEKIRATDDETNTFDPRIKERVTPISEKGK